MSVNEFLILLGCTYWNLTYTEFLERTGFAESHYSVEKFTLFKNSAKGLSEFDAETLSAILQAETNTINN